MEHERARRVGIPSRRHLRRKRILAGSIALTSTLGMAWVITAGEGDEVFSLGTGRVPAAEASDRGPIVVKEITLEETTHLLGHRIETGSPPFETFMITEEPGRQSSPDVVALPTGEFLVTWQHRDEGVDAASEIRGRRFDIDTLESLGDAFTISSSGGGTSGAGPLGIEFSLNASPAVDADDMGNVVVAWKVGDGRRPHSRSFRIRGRRFDADLGPLGIEFTLGRSNARPPALAVQPSGEFVVAWEGRGRNIEAQLFDQSGEPLDETFQVNSTRFGRQIEPSATVAMNGHFIIVWEQVTPRGEHQILGRNLDRWGRAISPEFQINVSGSLGLASPDVSADNFGNIVAVWRRLNNSGEGTIHARRIDLDAAGPLGIEFTVTANDALGNPSLAPGCLLFQVVWESETEVQLPDPELLGRCLPVEFDLGE